MSKKKKYVFWLVLLALLGWGVWDAKSFIFRPSVGARKIIGGIPFRYIPEGKVRQSLNNKLNGKEIDIQKGYWLSETEVTYPQWLQYTDESVVGEDSNSIKAAQYPKNNILEYRHIESFINNLNRQNPEYEFRLPTIIEWDYAARAGTTSDPLLLMSDEEVGQYAWFNYNGQDTIHKVASKKPNAWGLYDMFGNVSEYCYYIGKGLKQEIPLPDQKRLAIKGFSFLDRKSFLQAIYFSVASEENIYDSHVYIRNTGLRILAM